MTIGTGMAHIEHPHQGITNDWWTPPELVQALGEFDLDPCAGVGQIPLAKRVYTLPQDGLIEPWKGRVWCNPPYGPNVGQWAERMAQHGNGIMLIFARTETRAWRGIWEKAHGILLPARRITFLRPDGTKAKSGTAPSAFIAYGENNLDALREAQHLGTIKGILLTEWELCGW
jgi:hypothetical protein